jgi:hypothetical protein
LLVSLFSSGGMLLGGGIGTKRLTGGYITGLNKLSFENAFICFSVKL